MNCSQFTRGLVTRVVDENTASYSALVESAPPAHPTAPTDPYWARAADLLESLTPAQRDTFIAVVRQVTVDAVSSVLAVLDGVTLLPGQSASFELRYGNEVLSDALQDHFLAAVEDGTR